MARQLSCGEISLYTFKSPEKRRPVLVLTRQEVIHLLRTVMVAPITSSIRGAPSEVVVGVDEGFEKVVVAISGGLHIRRDCPLPKEASAAKTG